MRNLGLAICILSMAFAGCVSSGPSERDFAPILDAGWKPGFTFTYELEGHDYSSGELYLGALGDVRTQPIDERHEYNDQPSATYRIVNTNVPADDGPPVMLAVATNDELTPAGGFGDVAPDDASFDSLLAFDPSNLRGYDLSYSDYDCPACDRELTLFRTEFDAGYVEFPLVQGNRTTRFLDQYYWGNSPPSAAKVEVEVGGVVDVEGPNGPVEAIHIRYRPIQLSNEELEDAFAAKGYTNTQVRNYDVDMDQQMEVYYAPSLHNVVRVEIAMKGSYMMEIRNETHVFGYTLEVDHDVVLRLSAAVLLEGPEVPLGKVAELLGTATDEPLPGQNLPDGSKAPLPPAPARLALNGTTHRVLLGADLMVQVLPPPGYDADDVTVRVDGPGNIGGFLKSEETVSYTPTTPGSYRMLADVTVREETSSESQWANWTFAVDDFQEIELVCKPIISTDVPCDPSSLEIPDGFSNVSITATRTSQLPVFEPEASLRITRGGELVAEFPFVDGKAEGVVPGPDAPGDGDWTFEYDAAQDAAASIAVAVTSTYPIPE